LHRRVNKEMGGGEESGKEDKMQTVMVSDKGLSKEGKQKMKKRNSINIITETTGDYCES
jgi:hypothetical protein